MKLPKIVFVTENHTFGGGNRYVEDLINSFSSEFPETHLICNKEAINFFNLHRIKRPLAKIHLIKIFNLSEKIRRMQRPVRILLRVLLTPFYLLANLISLVSLKRKISRLNPDFIVLANGGYPASLFIAFYAAFFSPKNIPCVMSIVGTPTRKNVRITAKFWQYVDSQVGKNLKGIITNTENIKFLLASSFSMPTEKIVIVRNGLEINQYKPPGNVADKPLTIGFLSRVEKDKGIYETLEAFQEIAKKHANLKLVIVGSGAELENVKKVAANDPRISVLGYVADVSDFYSKFDVYVLPSYHEGLPYSLIEACRAG